MKINWRNPFSLHKQDVNLFYKLFLEKITHLLDIHAPITKLTIKEKKSGKTLDDKRNSSFKQKSIIYCKFIRSKEATSKKVLLKEFKYYKNLSNKLTRINKTNFYHTFFEEHKNDYKRTWNGTRKLKKKQI